VNTVLLRIFFHGMIALVPMADGSNHMTALLVNASKVPDVASKCVAVHTPKLRFLTSSAECIAAGSIGCKVVGGSCSCEARRQEISLGTTVKPAQINFNGQPPHKLPKTPADEGAEFSYMANILNLSGSLLNEDFVKLKSPPSALLDRMTFAYDSVEPCMLAARNLPAGGSEIHTFSFGRLGDPTGTIMGQAIAQMMAAQAIVPFDGTTNKVTLSIVGFDSPTSFTMNLLPEPCDPHGGTTPLCIDIDLANVRDSAPVGSGCDDGVGRDFAFFYELLKTPPPWEARLVPIDDNTVKVDAKVLEIKECADHSKAPMNRPICAMASFIQ
jgi:hypothetical protein